jgi:aspartate carbamoyltransferase catalytic subunit
MRHFLNITEIDRSTIEHLLGRAEQLLQTVVKKNGLLTTLAGQVVANLFFEPSTRTQYSFTIAAHRLSAFVLNPAMNHTSTVKGESLLDTVRTFAVMGARIVVIRHREDHAPAWLANELKEPVSLINGGDGCHQHPTQTLLDLLTIRQHKGDFAGLKVAIIGDIAHSRVARSLVQGLKIMGCTQIHVIAPPEFLPDDIDRWAVHHHPSITEGIRDADVVVALRIQLERMTLPPSAPEPAQFFAQFRLTTDNLRLANPRAIVMHPAPMNRETEITSAVADGPQSVIFQQVTNGVAVRMAVMEWLIS